MRILIRAEVSAVMLTVAIVMPVTEPKALWAYFVCGVLVGLREALRITEIL